jgi:DNA processing protein
MAVLACGVDRAYPAAHRTLLDYVAEVGLVGSELPPGSAPTRVRFLARNRVIAALGAGTVVVEAAVRSGALNTANWALRLHRVVMGVPGPVTSAPSEGVHELIRSHAATLVTRGEHVRELVAPAGSFFADPVRAAPRPEDSLSVEHRQLLDAVPATRPAPVESIARTGGLAVARADRGLERLAGLGLVERIGQAWRRAGARGDAG